MYKHYETAVIVLFFVFTWIPFQIVFLSAHRCKETNYGQTENIELEKRYSLKKEKQLPCNKEQKGKDTAKKHQSMSEKMTPLAQNHQMNETPVKPLCKIPYAKVMQPSNKSP